MSNELTTEEQIELIVKATTLGKKAKVRRNLVYMKTALGATFIPISEDTCATCGREKDSFSKEWEYSQCEICSMKEEDNGN